MDKALEVIMVAVILVVASVVIISMLQGQTGNFGGFAEDQTNSSDCGLSELEYERARNCQANPSSDGSAAASIRTSNSQCDWTDNGASTYC